MSLDDNEILNDLVRMVVSMRREFGRKLDIGQFMHDFQYATEVLAQARVSLDPRLREYGLYVEKRMHGARIADSAPPAPSPAADKATEDDLRAGVEEIHLRPALRGLGFQRHARNAVTRFSAAARARTACAHGCGRR